MKVHYDWPKASGKFSPFAAQIETANFVTMHNRCFILNSMGTGKTVSSLWAFDYMRSRKQVKKALIVCPLSTMERTWADEVFKTFPHLDVQVLYGSRARRQKLLKEDAHLYIINIDGLKTIEDDLKKRSDIDLIIIDEVAMFRNGSTNRWKTMNAIANKQITRRIWALTASLTASTSPPSTSVFSLLSISLYAFFCSSDISTSRLMNVCGGKSVQSSSEYRIAGCIHSLTTSLALSLATHLNGLI